MRVYVCVCVRERERERERESEEDAKIIFISEHLEKYDNEECYILTIDSPVSVDFKNRMSECKQRTTEMLRKLQGNNCVGTRKIYQNRSFQPRGINGQSAEV